MIVAACGDDDKAAPRYDVVESVRSVEGGQDLVVWAPDAEGSWPIAVLYHGLGGNAQGFTETATKLASRGMAVFGVNWRFASEPAGGVQTAQDSLCGLRAALNAAPEYGGDLDRPVTLVGHSAGASSVLYGGLYEAMYGPEGSFDPPCYSDTAASKREVDVIVAIAGCHYESPAGVSQPLDPSPWGNLDAKVHLVVGADDDLCAPWQSQDFAEALRAKGYDVEYVEVDGGDHWTVIFHDIVDPDDSDWVDAPDHPAGDRVVEVILDAAGIEH
jgi:acetyl esterase/lipase